MKIFLAGLIGLLLCTVAMAADTAADKAARQTVLYVEGPNGSGSAVVIAPGRLLTAHHVAVGVDHVRLRDGRDVPITAKRSFMRDGRDVAELTADVSCPCATISQTSPQPGDDVIAIGYPYGPALGPTQVLTRGEFQGFLITSEFSAGGRRPLALIDNIDGAPKVRLGMMTAALAPGNSGGGIFNAQGELIGLAEQITGDEHGVVNYLSQYAPIRDVDWKP